MCSGALAQKSLPAAEARTPRRTCAWGWKVSSLALWSHLDGWPQEYHGLPRQVAIPETFVREIRASRAARSGPIFACPRPRARYPGQRPRSCAKRSRPRGPARVAWLTQRSAVHVGHRHRERGSHRGRFLQRLARLASRRMSSGAIVIKEALKRAGGRARRGLRGHPGSGARRGSGSGPGAPGRRSRPGLPKEVSAWSVNMMCGSGLRAVALGYPGDPDRRQQGRGRRRPGEHEPRAALRAPARRRQDGRDRVRRHDDQGRPVGRVQRLPHGQHGRERRQAVGHQPPAAGRVRGGLAAEGGQGAGRRQVQGRDRHRS